MIRKGRFFTFKNSFLILFIFLLSCNTSTKSTTLKKDFTGEELFSGIYFGGNEFAKSISMLRDVPLKKEYQQKIEKLTLQINNSDSLFFKNFKKNILSKNHQLIRFWLEKGNLEIDKNKTIFLPNTTLLPINNSENINLLHQNRITKLNKNYKKDLTTLNSEILINEIAVYDSKVQ
ncbi:hypothetical protein [Polaribacter sp.]|uniref:hypothetical protein n=1 Tax=Polaribacter sp. TaxID=1920175 RepID=UPI003EF6CFA2